VAAIATTESGGDPNARSAVGAQGLMQLMPATARSLGVADPFDPVQNVRAGATYLRTLIDRFGNLRSAIAAYNAGPGAVARFGGVPPYAETRVYVERVLDAYRANLRR
jgi:soluble lytic murein transglycosylase-like protein